MSILVIAEHREGVVRAVSHELISAARALGGPVEVAVIARDPAGFDGEWRGADAVVHVPVAQETYENDVHQAAIEALIAERRPEAVLLGFTVDGMGCGAAIAAKLDLPFASDVFGLRREGDTLVATRAFHGAKVHADLELTPGRTAILLLRPTAWPPADGDPPAATSTFAVEPVRSRARHLSFERPESGDVDITRAEFILAIGRGVTDREDYPRFEQLAERLGATLAVSRPLVDAGWVTSARQVGQSGRTVAPKVYLALGISGAVQHLAGMRSSGTVIAVNTDAEAAIFDVADHGAVVDLYDVVEELERRL